jgi:hypothetical protein
LTTEERLSDIVFFYAARFSLIVSTYSQAAQ